MVGYSIPALLSADEGVVDDLEHVGRSDQRQREMEPAGAPPARDRHFGRGVGHLIAGDTDRLQDLAPHFLLRGFVDESVVVRGPEFRVLDHGVSAPPWAPAAARPPQRAGRPAVPSFARRA